MAKKKTESGKSPGRPANPPVTAETPLTDDERRWFEEWTVDRNCAAAYRRCYPDASWQSARRLGHLMRHRINVDAECRSHLCSQRVRSTVRADEVIKELTRLATSDILSLYDPTTNELRHPRHIPYDDRKAIASMKVARERRSVTRQGRTRTTVTNQVIEYRLWDKNAAIGRLMRHLGMEGGIEPLEALLAALPRQLAEEVRKALAEQIATRTAPSTNGNGKHHTNGTR